MEEGCSALPGEGAEGDPANPCSPEFKSLVQPLLPSPSIPRCQGRCSKDAIQGRRARQSLAGRDRSGEGPSIFQTEEESAGWPAEETCVEGKGGEGEEEAQRSQEGRRRGGHRKDFCSSSHSHLLLFLASPWQKRCQLTTSLEFLEKRETKEASRVQRYRNTHLVLKARSRAAGGFARRDPPPIWRAPRWAPGNCPPSEHAALSCNILGTI